MKFTPYRGITEEQYNRALELASELDYGQWKSIVADINRLYEIKTPKIKLESLEEERKKSQFYPYRESEKKEETKKVDLEKMGNEIGSELIQMIDSE